MFGMLRLYGRLAPKALVHALRAWPVALTLVAYTLLMRVVSVLLSPLGIVGSLIAMFAIAALVSSYLHLLAQAVAGRRPGLADLKESFGSRLLDVLSVFFAFWIIDLALTVLVRGMGPQGDIVRVLVGLTMAVFFNPVPELIYLGSSRSFSLLADAGRFISAHGPEWLFPNLLFGVAVLLPTGLLQAPELGARVLRLGSLFSLDGMTQVTTGIPLLLIPVMLMFVHWAMIFRGLLFQELSSGLSARQRAIRDVWGR